MSLVSRLIFSSLCDIKPSLLVPVSRNIDSVRNAVRKAGATARNVGGNKCKPKFRTWKVVDGQMVTAGSILATQNTLRWHPGLHAGMGKNGTIWAIEAGKVVISTEKVDLNWDHTWIQRHYSGRENSVIYKKHYNIIPEKQHGRFKLIDAI